MSSMSRPPADAFAELGLAPDGLHTDSDEIESDTHQWAAEQGLAPQGVDVLRQARFPRLAARIFPAEPATRVRTYARWLVILFALDDRSEQSTAQPDHIQTLYQQITAVLAGQNVEPQDPLVRAIREQWHRLPESLSPAWRDRFIRHLSRHGQALAWEARLRAGPRVPSLAAFMDLRPWSNGMFMWDLIEAVHPHEAPTPATRTIAWRYLTTCSNQITAWRNDLASFSKESAIGNHDNYVAVLAHTLGCGRKEASTLVERQITSRVGDLLDYEDALLEQFRRLPGPEIRALTDTTNTLRAITAAHARWIVESGRYRTAPNSPQVVLPKDRGKLK
ncbi:terpene synthase family protein [Streptomyces hyaluromycini]|uniref:terpene synthase family protein n=1 Tax=Streptomyces hyaluromycini TaxID=1377993 RepID=UPI000B5C58FB|nr:terpene synthase family protein [Streptomyces hyaluromycini]